MTPLTTQQEQLKERIAKMRSLGMEISPAMETICLKECEIAYEQGRSSMREEMRNQILEETKKYEYSGAQILVDRLKKKNFKELYTPQIFISEILSALTTKE